MGTKSRESIHGGSIRAAAERAAEARKIADRLAVEAWNKRMLGFQGPAQPSPTLGDALNGGYRYLEVKCLGRNTHQTIALDIVRRPKTTPVHELERYMRCKECYRLQGRPFKRSHLVALRCTKISANDPPSTWWSGELTVFVPNHAEPPVAFELGELYFSNVLDLMLTQLRSEFVHRQHFLAHCLLNYSSIIDQGQRRRSEVWSHGMSKRG